MSFAIPSCRLNLLLTCCCLSFVITVFGLTPPVRAQETLNWVSGGTNNFGLTDNTTSDTSNILCGNGNVTATFANPNNVAVAPFIDATANVTGGGARMTMDASSQGQLVRMTLAFTVQVDNFRFSIFDTDFDNWTDFVDVAALNGVAGTNVNLACANAPSPCPFSIANNNTPTATARGTASQTGFGTNNQLNVTVAGPVTRVTVTFRAGSGLAQQFIEIGGFSFDCTTVPVTLSSIEAIPASRGVHFSWTTATEAGNVGFHLYEQSPEGWQRLNERLIPSHQANSTVPQQYSYEATTTTGKWFQIADVDLYGREQRHKPFQLGEAVGLPPKPDSIDWAKITAASTLQRGLEARIYPQEIYQSAALATRTGPVAELRVAQSGLSRITYQQLLSAGVNLNGIAANRIALTRRQGPVPIRVAPQGAFGPGSFIEFSGEAVDSLYTRTNVYRLHIDSTLARRIAEDSRPIPATAPATFYSETRKVENNRLYSFAAPGRDPWYDTDMLTYTTSNTWTFPIEIDRLMPNRDSSKVAVRLWGVTDWPAAPDHHVRLALNGQPVADKRFDGAVDTTLRAELNGTTAALKEGKNILSITLPGDTGVDYDLVSLDHYAITYPRAFVARDGRLSFTAAAGRFQVKNLPSANVVVYQQTGTQLTRLTQVITKPEAGGTYNASFRGERSSLQYFVSTVAAMRVPEVTPLLPAQDITTGAAQYLIITHPKFINGLAPLVSARQKQRYRVRVVDVTQIYAQFSHGVVSAEAIKTYIAFAAKNMGTEYVLLVGGDTYDYLNYLGLRSVSFIPTLYAQTDAIVRFAPVDPLYTDLDNDSIPDLPIGRLPVRTEAELALVIAKTLAYPTAGHNRTALFAADTSFATDSDQFLAQLPPLWHVTRAYLDDSDVNQARTTLLDTMDQGVALASYVGHSGLTVWTFDGLFSANDATTLLNVGRPMVVTQWGCWNTYYVEPHYNTLAHHLLLNGNRGAAAVLGASTLTSVAAEKALANQLMGALVQPGQTLGMAMQLAKKALAAQQPQAHDVLLGWTLLGDPTLVIEP